MEEWMGRSKGKQGRMTACSLLLLLTEEGLGDRAAGEEAEAPLDQAG